MTAVLELDEAKQRVVLKGIISISQMYRRLSQIVMNNQALADVYPLAPLVVNAD